MTRAALATGTQRREHGERSRLRRRTADDRLPGAAAGAGSGSGSGAAASAMGVLVQCHDGALYAGLVGAVPLQRGVRRVFPCGLLQ